MDPLSDAIYLSISPIAEMIYGAIVRSDSVSVREKIAPYGFINFAAGEGTNF